jgi:peptidyl-prolyl cis-trans isomerase SurA
VAAFQKIMDLKKRLNEGEDFISLATAYSEDPSVRTNNGDLGYFTALQMVYPFETAAYETPVGKVSDPVRTKFGYHLVKVIDKRPAQGEVEVSHIMLRNGKDDLKTKELIFNIYDQLIAGASWDELCRQYSEDQSSKENGGRLRPFGAGAMASVPEFEKMAFTLRESGQISDPFQSSYGWHIMKLERKIPLPSFDEIKGQLKSRVARDERVQISQQALQKKLKTEFQFKENSLVKLTMKDQMDSLLLISNATGELGKQNLFTLQTKPYLVNDFLAYAKNNQTKGSGFEEMYDEFIEEKLMQLLEQKIVSENPEFAMLSNEYYEGILLFEIMEEEVWNKAADDSIGQLKYFNSHHSKYLAGERADASFYSSADSSFRPRLQALLTSHDSVAADRFARANNIREESGIYEKNGKELLNNIAWKPGIYSTEYNGMYYLAQIYGILPAGEKTFEEARASVVADYQQEIENTWIRLLREKYPVRINDKAKQYVLDKLPE